MSRSAGLYCEALALHPGCLTGKRTTSECQRMGAAPEPMARQLFGVSLRRWIQYLVAILLGNAIYYYSLVPHLPEVLHHYGFHVEWGMGVDFVVCVGVYGIIRLGSRL